jgi:hypothetical protein
MPRRSSKLSMNPRPFRQQTKMPSLRSITIITTTRIVVVPRRYRHHHHHHHHHHSFYRRDY